MEQKGEHNGKKKILKCIPLIIWIVAIIFLTLTSPSLTKLVSEKGGVQLPNGYSSKVAEQLAKDHGLNSNDSCIAVFHSDSELTSANKENIKQTVNNLKNDESNLHISNVLDSFNNPQLKSQMVSKDNKTIIVLFTLNSTPENIKDIRAALESKIKTQGVQTYLTGSKLIQADVNIAAQKGLQKTEGITIVFILVVLIIVFRSIIAPFIPLMTIGISYLVAQDVVAILAHRFNFPLSNYTQIFMICIMFGIGTDYSILLLSRFKAELSNGKDRFEAIKTTYKTAGKTVLFSATPVFVVFASLNFISFNLYRSAVAVAIGIVFLVLALFTIVPAFMALLGRNVFWPSKKNTGEKENKLWGKLGLFAFKKPIQTLIMVAVVTIPFIILNNWDESFNNVNEIGNQYSSKQGFNILTDSFGEGKASTTSIYIENDVNMKTPEYIALIEKISEDIKNSNSNITSVLSVTRPEGTRLDQIYVNDQASQVNKGVDKATNGINTVKDGLSSASDKLNDSKPQLSTAQKDVTKLQNGTSKTKDGVEQLQQALNELTNSINLETTGTNKLKSGIADAKSKLEELKTGQNEIQNGYVEVAKNLNEVSSKLNGFTQKINSGANAIDTSELQKIFNSLNSNLTEYINKHPEVMGDNNFKAVVNYIEQLAKETGGLQKQIENQVASKIKGAIGQLNDLNNGIKLLATSMNELNSKSAEVSKGLGEFNTGISQLEEGLDALDNGLDKTDSGSKKILGKVPEISSALTEIKSGQAQIKNGFKEFSNQVDELSSGLSSGANGLEEIQNGLKYANGFINDWSNLSYNDSGISVPVQIFNNGEFQKALNQYISPDGKLTEINVSFNENPYSNEAISEIPKLKDTVENSVKGTKLENANVGIGGIVSTSYETKLMANTDYKKAVAFVIIGVSIVLVCILRSLVMPIYLMASLILTYFTSLSIVELIVEHIMGYPGISWITSFFGFVVLMALGIDYSIFIMTRFNQYEGMPIKERMIKTMKVMGGVIISAVIILSGTFAALLPSGVLSLVEISLVVLTGILLYAIVILPLFIPAMVRIFREASWWPFMGKKIEAKTENKPETVDDSKEK